MTGLVLGRSKYSATAEAGICFSKEGFGGMMAAMRYRVLWVAMLVWLAGHSGLSAQPRSQEVPDRFEASVRIRMHADVLNLDHAQYALRGRRVERAQPTGNGGGE